MKGVSRIIHNKERDVVKVLHKKVIQELPSLEEVVYLFDRLIEGAISLDYPGDINLEYFFSSRTDAYEKPLYRGGPSNLRSARRTWAIVSYPLFGEAGFEPNINLPKSVPWKSTEWHQNYVNVKNKYLDPLFFLRNPVENRNSENAVFLFRKDPLNEGKKYIRGIQKVRNGICLPSIK